MLRLIVGLKEIIRINDIRTNTLGFRYIYSPISGLSIVLVLSLTNFHCHGPYIDFRLCPLHRDRVYATIKVRRNLPANPRFCCPKLPNFKNYRLILVNIKRSSDFLWFDLLQTKFGLS